MGSGQLVLGATLTGYSGKANSGGTLSLLAPLIQVGGDQLLNGDTSGGTFWLNQTDASGNLLPTGTVGTANGPNYCKVNLTYDDTVGAIFN